VKIVLVSGARSNYMKIAPIVWAIRRLNRRGGAPIQSLLIHTGQHYDPQLFDVFFRELDLPAPDYRLDVGSGSHPPQTARVMERLEPILQQERPDLDVVVGDVNSTVAAALTTAKLQFPLAHVEAGLRSFDRTMPEEINRMVTDLLSDYLFVTEESGKQNLLREGVDPKKIFFVGNVMIDSLQQSRHLWECSTVREELGLTRNVYGVMTLHRPANVDNGERLLKLMQAIAEVASRIPIVFPVHPRTRKQLEAVNGSVPGLQWGRKRVEAKGIYGLEPLGYLDFMALVAGARIVLTDSGGIQEETTFLNVPCLTLRENTERPVTVTHGTNRVIGTAPETIIQETVRVLENPRPALPAPPLWDGNASDRIVSILREKVKCCERGSKTTYHKTGKRFSVGVS
jgi:UDP-N-acetylglucosamine 2-epimerase (non-hydrolysing)